MMKWRILAIFGVCWISVLTTVGSAFPQTDQDHPGPGEESFPFFPNSSKERETLDDLMVRVGREGPDFGGLFLDEKGDLNIYLVDTAPGVAEMTLHRCRQFHFRRY